MSIWLVRFVGKVVVVHDLATDEAFERESRKHVQAEAKSSDLDHKMTLCRKVVENVALGLVAKSEKASQSHDETSNARDKCRIVSDSAKPIDGRCLERAIDQKRIMVADKGWHMLVSGISPILVPYQKR